MKLAIAFLVVAMLSVTAMAHHHDDDDRCERRESGVRFEFRYGGGYRDSDRPVYREYRVLRYYPEPGYYYRGDCDRYTYRRYDDDCRYEHRRYYYDEDDD